MKNGITIFKWASPIICLLIILAILNKFNCGGKTEIKEIIKIERDTVYTDTNTYVSYIPVPYRIETITERPVYIESDPEYKYLPLDSLPPRVREIVNEYYNRLFYKDTITVQYGHAVITDTLYKNKITGRGFSLSQTIPEITNTITLREKPRIKAYAGLEVMGTLESPISYTGLSFSLLMKNQNIIGIKGGIMKNGNELYGVEYRHLIRLRK